MISRLIRVQSNEHTLYLLLRPRLRGHRNLWDTFTIRPARLTIGYTVFNRISAQPRINAHLE